MKKKINLLLLMLCICITFNVQIVYAGSYNTNVAEGGVTPKETGEIRHSGYSNNVYWQLDSQGHLEIRGEGDWDRSNRLPPWCNSSFCHTIKDVTVNLSGATNLSYMFDGCNRIITVDFSGLDTSSVNDMSYMFNNCQQLKVVDLSGFNTSKVTDMNHMFFGCGYLTEVNMSGIDTSSVLDMSNLFMNCKRLTTVHMDNIDTSSVEAMDYMFYGCNAIKNIDLSSLDTSSVTNMYAMFWCCYAVEEINLSSFDTSSVTDMSGMFYDCRMLSSINVSNFDTSKVENMSQMFSRCYKLTELNVDNFDTSSVTDFGSMFSECTELVALDLSSFRVSAQSEGIYHTSMGGMFRNCANLQEIDISNLVLDNDCDMYGMFYGATSLNKLMVSKMVSFIMDNAFNDCQNLTIYGYEGTYACTYAKNHEIPFVALDVNAFGYNVPNAGSAFYKNDSDHIIPFERYEKIFNITYSEYYQLFSHEKFFGNCMGMAISWGQFDKGIRKLEDYYISEKGDYSYKSTFNEGSNTFFCLWDRNADLQGESVSSNEKLIELIEEYVIYQYSDEYMSRVSHENKVDAEELLNADEMYLLSLHYKEEDVNEENKKVITKKGHIVLTNPHRQPQKLEDDWYRVFIYDPNYPVTTEVEQEIPLGPDYNTERYIEVNKNGEWKIVLGTVTGGVMTEASSDNGDEIFIEPLSSIPTKFDKKLQLSPKITSRIQWCSPEIKVLSVDGRLMYQNSQGNTVHLDTSVIEKIREGSWSDDVERNLSSGVIYLPKGEYIVEFKDGVVAFMQDGNYAGIRATGDDEITVKNTTSTTLDISSQKLTTVNLVINEAKNDSSFVEAAFDCEVKEDNNVITIEEGKLSVETNVEQNIDIAITTEEDSITIDDVTTNEINEVDLSNPQPFCNGSHQINEVNAVEATCTEPGIRAYFQCGRCKLCFEDENATKQIKDVDTWKVIPANGHTEENIPAVAATTRTNGKTTGVKCSVCEEVLKKPTTIYKASKISLSNPSFIYDGKTKSPEIYVKDNKGNTLLKTDYKVTIPAGRKKVGEYVYKITLMGRYKGIVEKKLVIKPQKLSSSKISLSKTSYTYNGKKKNPSVTVKNANGTTLKLNKHYKVTYSKDRTTVGRYLVTIKGIGNYSGTITKPFIINPMGTSIVTVKPGVRNLFVGWKKQTKQTTGYEIQVAVNKKFTNNLKKILIPQNTTVKKSVTRLISGKRYYVRIRTYKTIGKKKYYSDWSKERSVKIK